MFIFPMMFPKLPTDYNIPPTIYSLLNSYVNFGNQNEVKISNLASAGREMFFDFNYPLTDAITKEDFEVMILNHFMMRRIGYETVTAFKLALNVKLNEVMPMYNKLFDAISDWNIFEDKEVTSRTVADSRTTNNTTTDSTTNNVTTQSTDSSISDRRYSNMPQNELTEIQNGKYISDYNYDTNSNNNNTSTSGTGSSNGTNNTQDSGTLQENITKNYPDKMKHFQEFLSAKQNIYTMIFKDLDVLFYQII